MSIIEARSISLHLGGRQILTDVSLDLAPGEVVGLAGPNGAGKTSFFEVLSGRLPQHKGQVLFNGTDITNKAMHERTQLGIGRTFQRPIVPAALTVAETLTTARKAYRPRPTRLEVEWAKDFVHLHAHDQQPTDTLETLERRKLMFACLMVRRPQVLLLDEPASGLTGSEIDEIDLIIRKLSTEYGIAILLIEHRLELLAGVASRVGVLDVGEIIAMGSPDSVFSDTVVRAAYFATVDDADSSEAESA